MLLASLNLIAIFVVVLNISTNHNQVQLTSTDNTDYHNFINPELALLILKELDIPNNPYPHQTPNAVYLGMKRDSNYCDRVRKHFVYNPHYIFEETNFFCTYFHHEFVKSQVVPAIGNDILKHVTPGLPKAIKDTPTYDLPVNVTALWTKKVLEGTYFESGKEIVCLTQSSNHIAGISVLSRKDQVARSVYNYTKRFQDKPQCFDDSKFFPKTWNLDDPEQCREWFNVINSEKYQEEKKKKIIVYIRKIGAGSHKGEGVEPVHEEEEKALRQKYDNGNKCGSVKNTYIVQYYIHNPLLVMGHKFDFRVYMMIASTDPLIAYYHDGFLRVSLFEYDVSKNEKGMHLTNTAQSKKAIEKAKDSGMNETELMNFQMWNYTRLADYLIAEKMITSRDWLDEYLRPALMNAMQHLIRMTQFNYFRHSAHWEFFGVDFMLDQDLNLWFIECNSVPALEATNKEKEAFLMKLLKDQFEIVNGLLRSRIKRVINYVNMLIKNGLVRVISNEDGNTRIELDRYAQRRKEFADLIKNRFEEEFEVSSDNEWYKIIDESVEGLGRYNGNIGIECFD
mgnify:CR=1 FL=1